MRAGLCAASCLAALAANFAAANCAAETIRITVDKLAFVPAQVSAHVGDTIEWTNNDFVAHTATARSGEWNVMLPPHKVGSVTLKSAGSIEYYCRFHPNMIGHISVAKE